MVYYNYPTSGVGAALSRLEDIADDQGDQSGRTRYAAYGYLGAGTMVKVAYPAVTATPGGDPLSLAYGTRQDSYSGFDRFGRVVDQKWAAGAAVRDYFTYAYDRAGNRLYRTNELNHNLDELYHANGASGAYDGLDRLRDFRRGTLSDTNSDGVPDTIATVSRIQEWTLDAVGNWGGFKSSATTQSWDLDQTRAHNKANEIEDTVNQPPDDISGTPNWIDPDYDAAGNMSAGPQPRYETADAKTQLYVYDAWNRLTKIYQDADSDDTIDDPGELVATYSYDGQNRRIRKVVAGGDTYDYYYNESWQVLEVRKASRTNKTYQQYVWGAQYIDAPVVQFRDTADDGTLDQALYYTYDGQFNVTAMFNTHAAWAERYVYDPYGQVTIYDGTWSNTRSTSAYDNEILYCGYRFDPESGNYHVRRRYLTPPLGRWTTREPGPREQTRSRPGEAGRVPLSRSALGDSPLQSFVALPPMMAPGIADTIGGTTAQHATTDQYHDGLSLYQYVTSRPTVFFDPTGLYAVPIPSSLPTPPIPPLFPKCWKCPDPEPGLLPFVIIDLLCNGQTVNWSFVVYGYQKCIPSTPSTIQTACIWSRSYTCRNPAPGFFWLTPSRDADQPERIFPLEKYGYPGREEYDGCLWNSRELPYIKVINRR